MEMDPIRIEIEANNNIVAVSPARQQTWETRGCDIN